jgi:hypothetical protein
MKITGKEDFLDETVPFYAVKGLTRFIHEEGEQAVFKGFY